MTGKVDEDAAMAAEPETRDDRQAAETRKTGTARPVSLRGPCMRLLRLGIDLGRGLLGALFPTCMRKGAGLFPYSHARPPLLSEHVGEQLHDVQHIEILLVLLLVLKLATAFSKPGGSDSERCSPTCN